MMSQRETAENPGVIDLGRQRSAVLWEIAIAFPIALALWLAVYELLPPIEGMDEIAARLVFALKACCIAILFCFLTGTEAVAHERLRSAAIDPLSGYDTKRMRINLRYLQNTLEQLILFVPGLFALAVYCPDGRAMRAIAATTLVWIASRAVFWIGYHFGPLHRAVGAPGMMQSMLILLYVCARFGFELAGWAGAVTPLVLFAGVEIVLFRATRPLA
ncbi:MAG: MAPEG family protein [Aliidongia sp.]